MRLVHFADTHLGFRQFDRDIRGSRTGIVAPDGEWGKNLRQADIEKTFHTLIDQVIAIAPELIVIGGDVFHTTRPSNGTIIHSVNEFRRLTLALPATKIVIACGNHDIPMTRESVNIVTLLEPLGIHVADREAKRFNFPELDLSVLAVPDAAGMKRPPLEPDPAFGTNVMVLHGEVEGILRKAGSRIGVEIPTAEMQAPTWNYVALGHWHVYRELAPNMFYSGAMDYTSSDPWGELREEAAAKLPGKGFIERDLATGAHTFHPLPRSRDHLDLALDADGMTSEDLNAALRELVDDAWVDDAIVRVVITNVPVAISRELEPKMLREYKARAMNFKLDLRRPEVIRIGTPGRRGGTRQSLEEIVSAHLKERFFPGNPSGFTYEEMEALASRYLAQAGAKIEGQIASGEAV